jgi:hypothetical protein
MWWLQFEDGTAAIVAASSLVQARLLAMIEGLGRAAALVEGYEVDAEFLQMIPHNRIGKRLSKIEVDEVLERLKLAARYSASSAAWVKRPDRTKPLAWLRQRAGIAVHDGRLRPGDRSRDHWCRLGAQGPSHMLRQASTPELSSWLGHRSIANTAVYTTAVS